MVSCKLPKICWISTVVKRIDISAKGKSMLPVHSIHRCVGVASMPSVPHICAMIRIRSVYHPKLTTSPKSKEQLSLSPNVPHRCGIPLKRVLRIAKRRMKILISYLQPFENPYYTCRIIVMMKMLE